MAGADLGGGFEDIEVAVSAGGFGCGGGAVVVAVAVVMVGLVCLFRILLRRGQSAVRPVSDAAGEVVLGFVCGRGEGLGALQVVGGRRF